MALNSNIKVEMPPHCVKVPKNGTTYIQYTLRAYRDAKGRPTSSRIAIGKLDAETGMLIPNRNYYEVFQKEMPPKMPEKRPVAPVAASPNRLVLMPEKRGFIIC